MQTVAPLRTFTLIALIIVAGGWCIAQTSITITSTTPFPPGNVGRQYFSNISVGTGQAWTSMSITNGSLPPGLALVEYVGIFFEHLGSIQGYPTTPGTYAFTVTVYPDPLANLNPGSKSFTMTINPALVITTSSVPAATVSGSYSYTLSATGGTGPRTWASLQNSLPPGMGFREDGFLYGTPSTPGTFNFTALTWDSIGATAEKTLPLLVNPSPSITTRSLAAATVNVAYSTALQADGGTAPLTWTITGGSLPKGFSLTSAGTISGKSSDVSSNKVKITVTDRNLVASSTNYEFIVGAATSTGVEEGFPAEYSLGQNYPNPFNPTSEIRFGLPAASHVRIALYNTLGQLMSVLLDEQRGAGTHAVTVDADRLPSGLYYYAMEAGGKRFVRKALVLK